MFTVWAVKIKTFGFFIPDFSMMGNTIVNRLCTAVYTRERCFECNLLRKHPTPFGEATCLWSLHRVWMFGQYASTNCAIRAHKEVTVGAYIFVTVRKRHRHRHRFWDTGALDQEIVETPLCCQVLHNLNKILSKGAANAAVRQFNYSLAWVLDLNHLCVDVDLHMILV